MHPTHTKRTPYGGSLTQPNQSNFCPNTYSWKGARELSTGTAETRLFAGDCFRCGMSGHWADDPQCPWLTKAGTRKEHEARITAFVRRFHDWEITPHQKRQFIEQENAIWKVKA